MTTFRDLVRETKRRFDEHGFDGALEVHLTHDQAIRAQRDPEVALHVINQAISPDAGAPSRPGLRLFATVDGVRVYVRS